MHHVGLSYIQVTPAVATAVELIVGVERWTYGAICDNYGIVEQNLYSGPILTKTMHKHSILHFYTQTSLTSNLVK